MFEEENSISTIVITVLAVIFIVLFAFLFFYYTTKQVPQAYQNSTTVKPVNQKPVVEKDLPTNVIKFIPPEVLPAIQKDGYCFASSIAQPFRQDAFRCIVVNSIYDPCFTILDKRFVYCQVGIDSSTGFLIKLTKPLPKPEIPPVLQDNWAWYLKLDDGTVCSPFTGTRPFFGQDVAFYGCVSENKDQQILLLGDLIKGQTWTANKAIVIKNGSKWEIKSTEKINVDTVWQ